MQQYILALDGTSSTTSIAIANENDFNYFYKIDNNKKNSVELVPSIFESLKLCKIDVKELGTIIVNKGPGSFTGCRLTLCAAIGIGQILNIPIIAPSNFDLLCFLSKDFLKNQNYLFCIGNQIGYAFIKNDNLKAQVVLSQLNCTQKEIINSTDLFILNQHEKINIPILKEKIAKSKNKSYIIDAKTLIAWYIDISKTENLDDFKDLSPLYLDNPYIK